MLIGIFLILFGALMLLDRLNLIDIRVGEYLLPVILIALGASMVFKGTAKASRPGGPRK